jgi:hypothetical protein
LVKDFLAKNNATTLENPPPQSPDPENPNFYLFPHLEADLNGPRFCDATAVIKNAMKELKSFHKMASTNVSNTFTVTDRSVYLHKGNYL